MGFLKARNMTDSSSLMLDDFNHVRVYTTTVTTAQILGMNSTPVVVVPDPDANQLINVEAIQVQFKPGTTQFASGGAITFVYRGGSVNPHLSTANIPAATITSASSSNNIMPPVGAVIQPPAGKGITMSNATGAFTTGNGTMIVTVFYTVTNLQ